MEGKRESLSKAGSRKMFKERNHNELELETFRGKRPKNDSTEGGGVAQYAKRAEKERGKRKTGPLESIPIIGREL